jgi:hypothetical protein
MKTSVDRTPMHAIKYKGLARCECLRCYVTGMGGKARAHAKAHLLAEARSSSQAEGKASRGVLGSVCLLLVGAHGEAAEQVDEAVVEGGEALRVLSSQASSKRAEIYV